MVVFDGGQPAGGVVSPASGQLWEDGLGMWRGTPEGLVDWEGRVSRDETGICRIGLTVMKMTS